MEQTSNTLPLEHKNNSVDAPLIVMTRIFQAPVEWVWKAWTDPKIIEQWWGTTGNRSKFGCVEFREGGKFFVNIEEANGSIIWRTGTYEKIIPHKKIVCTDSFSDKDGNIVLGNDIGMLGNWPRKLYITIEFEEIDPQQTKMVVSHEGVPKDGQDECVEGWNESLDKFAEVVERYGNEHLNMIQ